MTRDEIIKEIDFSVEESKQLLKENYSMERKLATSKIADVNIRRIEALCIYLKTIEEQK